MTKLLSLGVVTLLIGTTAMTLSGSQHRDVDNAVREQFAGAWRRKSVRA